MESEIECNPNELIKVLTQAETKEIEKQWMKVFCKNKQGFNTKAYKWHIFSGNGFPSIEGDEAQKEYDNRKEKKYIVMGNEGELAILINQKPNSYNYKDYNVFPVNMAWNMAFTHEEGWLGPYFAYHPNYKVLNKENEKLIEKEHQKEDAQNKGWL